MKGFYKHCFFVSMSIFCSCVFSTEYLYPVGSVIFEETERIVVLYQQNAHLELWLWDPITRRAIKGLSHYTPAGLVVLPSHMQLSFIDHERIRIKCLSKKSPKALDMYPLYDFGLIYWIDDENAYCSAREHYNFGIFHITTDGNLYRLARSSTCDYTYPQKKGPSLFYIKRTETGKYSIEKALYPTKEISSCQTLLHHPEEMSAPEKIEWMSREAPRSCLSQQQPETIFICDQETYAISFLTMKSETEGYFLKHVEHPFLGKYDKTMLFECWHLIKEKTWSAQKLFSFSIPLSLLYGEQRLYESILRLLPSYQGPFIFYVSATDEGYLHVHRYSTLSSTSTCVTQGAREKYLFSPYFFHAQGWCGGMIKTEENCLSQGPTLEEADSGELLFTFPTIDLPTKA